MNFLAGAAAFNNARAPLPKPSYLVSSCPLCDGCRARGTAPSQTRSRLRSHAPFRQPNARVTSHPNARVSIREARLSLGPSPLRRTPPPCLNELRRRGLAVAGNLVHHRG
jgi:hypothetical protein